jgi:hypothetical protein
MKRRVTFLLLCLSLVLQANAAVGQTIQTDKDVYDLKDTITVVFSYGEERDYSAFVFISPIKDGGSRYASNAYDQPTGQKVIDDHRFPPGKYQVVLEYPSPDNLPDPATGGRILAKSTFEVTAKEFTTEGMPR